MQALLHADDEIRINPTGAAGDTHAPDCDPEDRELIERDGRVICTNCARCSRPGAVMAEGIDRLNGVLHPRQRVVRQTYNRRSYADTCIAFVAMDSVYIPEHLLRDLRRTHPPWMETSSVTKSSIRAALHAISPATARKWLDRWTSIRAALTGERVPELAPGIRRWLLAMWEKASVAWPLVRPPSRSHFPHAATVIRHLLVHCGCAFMGQYYPGLASVEKNTTIRQYWGVLCADLGWPDFGNTDYYAERRRLEQRGQPFPFADFETYLQACAEEQGKALSMNLVTR